MANTYRMIHIVLALYKYLYDKQTYYSDGQSLRKICLEKNHLNILPSATF
jgi:hypothetical protein